MSDIPEELPLVCPKILEASPDITTETNFHKADVAALKGSMKIWILNG
jgi:hypothetical protein